MAHAGAILAEHHYEGGVFRALGAGQLGLRFFHGLVAPKFAAPTHRQVGTHPIRIIRLFAGSESGSRAKWLQPSRRWAGFLGASAQCLGAVTETPTIGEPDAAFSGVLGLRIGLDVVVAVVLAFPDGSRSIFF